MDAVRLMQIFGTLTYVAIAIAAVGLILAVIFFFAFDIRDVYALRTGKAKREAIERMSARNEQTGHLRPATTSGSLTASTPTTNALTSPPPTDDNMKAADGTTLLNTSSAETTVLDISGNETTVLAHAAAPAAQKAPVAPAQPTPKPSTIRFDISDSTVVIHTDEMI